MFLCLVTAFLVAQASSPEDVVSIRQSQVGLGTYTPPPTSPPSSRTADVVPVCCLAGPPPPPPPLSHQGIWPAKDQDMSSSTQVSRPRAVPSVPPWLLVRQPNHITDPLFQPITHQSPPVRPLT